MLAAVTRSPGETVIEDTATQEGDRVDGGLRQRPEVPAETVFAGPPLIVEASGETTVLPAAIRMISPAGRAVVVGMSSGTAALPPGAFPEKDIDVIGSSCAIADDFRAAISLVKANRAALFSHHFPLIRGRGIRHETATGRRQDRGDRELKAKNSPPKRGRDESI